MPSYLKCSPKHSTDLILVEARSSSFELQNSLAQLETTERDSKNGRSAYGLVDKTSAGFVVVFGCRPPHTSLQGYPSRLWKGHT